MADSVFCMIDTSKKYSGSSFHTEGYYDDDAARMHYDSLIKEALTHARDECRSKYDLKDVCQSIFMYKWLNHRRLPEMKSKRLLLKLKISRARAYTKHYAIRAYRFGLYHRFIKRLRLTFPYGMQHNI